MVGSEQLQMSINANNNLCHQIQPYNTLRNRFVTLIMSTIGIKKKDVRRIYRVSQYIARYNFHKT